MIRALLILTLSFAVGFALCLVLRAGLHRPYAGGGSAATGAEMPMASVTAPTPAEHGAAASGPATAPPHMHGASVAPDAIHAAAAAAAPAGAAPAAARATPARPASSGPELGLPRLGVETGMVNTVCPVCGAAVDPALQTSLYHGRIIGFGCRPNRCKERFDADPERYGPAALADRKAE